MHRKLIKCKLYSKDENEKTTACLCVQIFLCELIGMFYFIFIGCSSLHIVRYKAWDFFGGVLGFCFIIVSCMQFMQFTSGGYLNPALTLGMFLVGYIDLIRALVLIFAQIIGSILGFYILKILSIRVFDRTEAYWCCTVPSQESILVLVAWEFVSTSFLIASFFILTIPSKKEDIAHPGKSEFNFTFTLLSAIYPIAEYSGISMNPARSLGPATINDCWDHHWIYWFGPLLAALVTSEIWNLVTETRYTVESDQEKNGEPSNLVVEK